MTKQQKERKFIGLPVTPDEYDAVNRLLVAETSAKEVPLTRADIFRDALNLKSMQVTGQEIFTEKQAAQ